MVILGGVPLVLAGAPSPPPAFSSHSPKTGGWEGGPLPALPPVGGTEHSGVECQVAVLVVWGAGWDDDSVGEAMLMVALVWPSRAFCFLPLHRHSASPLTSPPKPTHSNHCGCPPPKGGRWPAQVVVEVVVWCGSNGGIYICIHMRVICVWSR